MDTDDGRKSVFVIAPTPFFADRGCHVRILEEVRALIVQGYRVSIFTYHIGRDIPGIETQRMIKIPWYTKLSAGPSVHKFYLDLFLLWTVIRGCLKERPDIIHAHLHEGVFIGKVASLLFRRPLVADLQGSLTGELIQHQFIRPHGLLYRIFRWLEYRIMRMPHSILISSTNVLAGLGNEKRNEMKKVEVIQDGVDAEQFQQTNPSHSLRARLGISPGSKVVGFLGVLTEYQGVSVLLESIPHVMRDIKNVHFLIMGYPNVDYYQAKTRTLGVAERVTFTGRIPYEDVPRYLAACNVAVSPKFSTTEANGKLLHYMAAGLPVVVSDTPVNREILGDLGIYARVGDPLSLAQALIGVLSDATYAQELGREARRKALTQHSWHVLGERISNVYRNLIDENQMKSPEGQDIVERRV